MAAKAGSLELVRFWLDEGIDVHSNPPDYRKTDGLHTPLHGAIDVASMKLLIERGADLNSWNRWNGTPLHGAVVTGSYDKVRFLLEAGADPTIEDYDGMTPLALAIKYDREEVIEELRGVTPEEAESTKPKRKRRPPAIDLQRDAERMADFVIKSAARFSKLKSTPPITSLALLVNGIEGFVMVALDTKGE
ncbi:MAG: ankyrin repeat domain-containing protein, partial [Planctomycetota bacterium]